MIPTLTGISSGAQFFSAEALDASIDSDVSDYLQQPGILATVDDTHKQDNEEHLQLMIYLIDYVENQILYTQNDDLPSRFLQTTLSVLGQVPEHLGRIHSSYCRKKNQISEKQRKDLIVVTWPRISVSFASLSTDAQLGKSRISGRLWPSKITQFLTNNN